MKKLISATVILLFIGLAFAPSINANNQSDFVEFTTEVCGLNGGKKTVKLTQQQADEVKELFDSINMRLNATKSREGAEEIFKDAVVELDKYGLLGGLSVNQAQRLVTGGFYNSKLIKTIEKRIKNNHIYSENVDFFCLITGKTNNTIFIPIGKIISNNILSSISYLWYFLENHGFNLGRNFFYTITMSLLMFQLLYPLRIFFPLAVGNGICFGYSEYDICYGVWTGHTPAEGFLVTYGLNGSKRWDRIIYGQISIFWAAFLVLYIGVRGFTGLKIINDEIIDEVNYIGSVLSVALGENVPLYS